MVRICILFSTFPSKSRTRFQMRALDLPAIPSTIHYSTKRHWMRLRIASRELLGRRYREIRGVVREDWEVLVWWIGERVFMLSGWWLLCLCLCFKCSCIVLFGVWVYLRGRMSIISSSQRWWFTCSNSWSFEHIISALPIYLNLRKHVEESIFLFVFLQPILLFGLPFLGTLVFFGSFMALSILHELSYVSTYSIPRTCYTRRVPTRCFLSHASFYTFSFRFFSLHYFSTDETFTCSRIIIKFKLSSQAFVPSFSFLLLLYLTSATKNWMVRKYAVKHWWTVTCVANF